MLRRTRRYIGGRRTETGRGEVQLMDRTRPLQSDAWVHVAARFIDGYMTLYLNGEVLARWGVAKNFELRFVLPTYSRENGSGGSSSGFLSSGIGVKLQLTEGSGSGFLGGMESAVIASTTVPTGTADFSSSDWQPAGVFCASWGLTPTVGIGTNLGVSRPAGDGTRYTTFWASVALGVGLTDQTSVFFELYGFNREEDRGPNTATFLESMAGSV